VSTIYLLLRAEIAPLSSLGIKAISMSITS